MRPPVRAPFVRCRLLAQDRHFECGRGVQLHLFSRSFAEGSAPAVRPASSGVLAPGETVTAAAWPVTDMLPPPVTVTAASRCRLRMIGATEPPIRRTLPYGSTAKHAPLRSTSTTPASVIAKSRQRELSARRRLA
jgi:hypothetical protein